LREECHRQVRNREREGKGQGAMLISKAEIDKLQKNRKQKTKPRDTNHNSDAVGVEDTIKVSQPVQPVGNHHSRNTAPAVTPSHLTALLKLSQHSQPVPWVIPRLRGNCCFVEAHVGV